MSVTVVLPDAREKVGRADTAAPSTRLWSIQYLRAIAAVMVVAYHAGHVVARAGYAGGWPWPLFWSGVDVFFVVSGVVMWHSTIGRAASPGTFWRHRLRRIVPLYWCVTAFVLLMLLAAPGSVKSGRFDLAHAVASFLFLPWTNPATGLAQPVVIPGWSLNAEMVFYLVFGLCLTIPPRWRIAAVAACLATPVVLVRLLTTPGTALAFYGDDIMLEFVLGLILGRALDAGRALPTPAAAAAIVGGFVALALFGDASPHVLAAGLPALAIVAGATAIEARGHLPRLRPVKALGDASYALYLTHGIVLSLFGRVLVAAGIRIAALPGAFVATLVGIALSVAAALIVHRHVERRLDRAADRLLRALVR